MFDKFTERGRKAMSLNHEYLGTEHMLIALCHVPDGPVPEAFAEFGVGSDAVLREVIEFVPKDQGPSKP